MFVSFPLLAASRSVARAIAASGVSDLDDEPEPARSDSGPATGRPVTWRSPHATTNPYTDPTPACPECSTRVVRAGGCIGCPACGWGKCG